MEKKNNLLVIISIVLALLVGLLGGYILTDKFASNDDVSQEDVDVNKDNDIDNTCEPIIETISYEENGKSLFEDYLKEKGAINYQINSVNLVIGCSKEFVLLIGYDVEVEGNPHDSNFGAGSGEVDGQWIKNKSDFARFVLENESYKFYGTATGYSNNFNACSEGRIVIATNN